MHRHNLSSSSLLYYENVPLCWKLIGSWIPSGSLESEKAACAVIWIGNQQPCKLREWQFLSTMTSGRERCSQREGLTVDMMPMDVMQRHLGTGPGCPAPGSQPFWAGSCPEFHNEFLFIPRPKARFNTFLILGTKWALNTKGINPSKSWQQQKL